MIIIGSVVSTRSDNNELSNKEGNVLSWRLVVESTSVTSFWSFFCPDTGLHSSLVPFQGVIFQSRTKIKPSGVSFLCVFFLCRLPLDNHFLALCCSSDQVLFCVVIYF